MDGMARVCLALRFYAGGEQVDFGAAFAGGFGFADFYLRKMRGEVGAQGGEVAALEYFYQQAPLRGEVLDGEVYGEFCQIGGACLVGYGDAGNVGRHVREYDIDLRTGECVLQLAQRGVFAKIALNEVHAGNGFHRQQVQRKDAPVRRGARHCYLRPRTGRGAQVDDDLPGAQKVVALVNFHQFESGARTPAFAPRALHPDIGDVFVHPRAPAFGSFHGCVPLRAAALECGLLLLWLLPPCPS